MAILVLGAGGFVGGYILGYLQKNGHESLALSREAPSNRKEDTFVVGPNGEFEPEKLLDFFYDKKIQHVIHCANKFSRNQSVSVANQMLQVNYLLPARVLRVAIEVSALSFINLASAWQVTRGRLQDAPDYVSSKEAFRQQLDLNGDRIAARTLFVNQIFGPEDPRKKLINQAFQSAINKEIIEVKSEMSQLGLVFLPRLASEITALISNDLARPGTYIYENYSRVLIKDLLSDIGMLLGVGKFWQNLGLDAESRSTAGFTKFGQCARESFVEDLAALVPSGYLSNGNTSR